jgi:NTP pyrophosphatase (non-canonical NTP hydrolase)
MVSYQDRCDKWLVECFGEVVARDKVERNHRFVEESLELVQACDITKEEVLKIVDYVFDRPKGEIGQEVGGVMNTLAALCVAHGVDLERAADRELERCWEKIDKIRAKRLAKPDFSA